MTAATPITMPRIVSPLRRTLTRRVAAATRTSSRSFMTPRAASLPEPRCRRRWRRCRIGRDVEADDNLGLLSDVAPDEFGGYPVGDADADVDALGLAVRT